MSNSTNTKESPVEPTKEATPEKNSLKDLLLSLALNILIPSLVLFKLSDESRLGPFWSLMLALLFPFVYGTVDLILKRKINTVSVLGLVNVMLTGVIGRFELDGQWLAIKEASVPLVIGLAGIISIKTRKPFVRTLIYNDKVIKVDKVDQALAVQGKTTDFDRLLTHSTLMISGSFFLSSVLNYALARIIVVSAAGTAEFNAELGRMMMLSYPVIVVPSMIVLMLTMWYLFAGIKRFTQLNLEEIFQVK